MTWVLVIGATWLVLAALIAVLIGRSVRLADDRAAENAAADEPNFVIDPATAPRGFPAATVLPFPPPSAEDPQTQMQPPPVRDTPTVPGIPVARPQAPGAGEPGSQIDPIRKSGRV
jgi:hypothetical protein